MRLAEKVAIMTGSTSGIGRAVAVEFSREGAKLALTGRNPERLAEVEKTIKTAGGECIGILGELTRLPEINRLVESTIKEFGRLDILVNCHGIFELAAFLETSEEFYEKTMSVDLKSVFFMCQRAAKEMIKQGKGKIINFSSIGGGKFGFPNGSVYCAAKGGIASLTQVLALELAPHSINVNAISPGNIRTPINEHLFAHPDYLKNMLDITPLGRIGETKDITGAAVYLASEESDYVTGIQLVVDGGVISGPC